MIHGVERPPGLGTVHCQEDLRGHQAAVSRSTTRRPSVRIVVTFQVQVRSQPAPESDSSWGTHSVPARVVPSGVLELAQSSSGVTVCLTMLAERLGREECAQRSRGRPWWLIRGPTPVSDIDSDKHG
jgi:hypothetical protein